ncbi:MAG: hypothetical protein JRD68_00005 [Deltaproteobacteria bacterium]|nr:hypothetical protein [Deltaproteobacteria bacterium]
MAAKKFKKEYGKDVEYFMLMQLTDTEISINSKLAIFREYTAAFKDTVSPAGGATINLLNAPGAQIGGPQLLEEHPAVALPVQKSDAGKEPADVIEIDSKQTMEGE